MTAKKKTTKVTRRAPVNKPATTSKPTKPSVYEAVGNDERVTITCYQLDRIYGPARVLWGMGGEVVVSPDEIAQKWGPNDKYVEFSFDRPAGEPTFQLSTYRGTDSVLYCTGTVPGKQ